jgi:biofilm PGA synthesis N-glycosyltransferase PgaC
VSSPCHLVAVAVTGDLVLDFVFFPLLMSALWMAGGLYFYLHLEREWKWGDRLEDREVPLPGSPQVAIIIPASTKKRMPRRPCWRRCSSATRMWR